MAAMASTKYYCRCYHVNARTGKRCPNGRRKLDKYCSACADSSAEMLAEQIAYNREAQDRHTEAFKAKRHANGGRIMPQCINRKHAAQDGMSFFELAQSLHPDLYPDGRGIDASDIWLARFSKRLESVRKPCSECIFGS